MKCAACKRDFEESDPLFKIYTYHQFNDSVNEYPTGYVHALVCPPTDTE